MNNNWFEMESQSDYSFSLDELKTVFDNIEFDCTLQCSGNRGDEFYEIGHLRSNQPLNGLISNARWKGVRIRDVLLHCGYNRRIHKQFKYVTFYGLDTDLSATHYAMSVPISHIMNEGNDCLLAFEMNGEDLPPDHGFPLRVLLPGVAGCRNVKWLGKIQLTEEEVQSPWQIRSYKPFKHRIYDMPVTSVICKPMTGQKVDIQTGDTHAIHCEGFAWSGGGRGIIRVEVSVDGGQTWNECALQSNSKSGDICDNEFGRDWSWTLWEIDIPIKKTNKGTLSGTTMAIMCRAMDTAFNSQPKNATEIVNGTMYVNNSWHKIKVEI